MTQNLGRVSSSEERVHNQAKTYVTHENRKAAELFFLKEETNTN